MNTKRILFFAPFGSWLIHNQVDAIVASALRLRGCEVVILACDGIYHDECCILNSTPKQQRKNVCTYCQIVSKNFFQETFRLPYIKLSEFIDNEDIVQATDWVESISIENYENAVFENLPLGNWIISSVYTYFRITSARLKDPEVIALHKQFLIYGVLTFKLVSRMMDRINPTNVFLFNARFFPYRIAFEIARSRNIDVIVHERGAIYDSFSFRTNYECNSYEPVVELAQKWESAAMQANELNQIIDYFKNREEGVNLSWPSFYNYQSKHSDVRKILRIPQTARIVSVFTSSEDELAASTDYAGIQNQLEIIDKLIRIFSNRKEYLVIRHHPNIGGQMINGFRYKAEISFIERAYRQTYLAPPNVRIIMPREMLTSYALLWNSDASIAFYSTIALESLARGVPTVTADNSPFALPANFVIQDTSIESLAKVVDDLLKVKVDYSILQRLYRFAYTYFFRFSHKFKSFGVKDDHACDIRIKAFEELVPGVDPELDRICNHIMKGTPLHALPTRERFNEKMFKIERQVLKKQFDDILQYKTSLAQKASAIPILDFQVPVRIIPIVYQNMPQMDFNTYDILNLRSRHTALIFSHMIKYEGGILEILEEISDQLLCTNEDFCLIANNRILYDESFISTSLAILLSQTQFNAVWSGGYTACSSGIKNEIFTDVILAYEQAVQQLPSIKDPIAYIGFMMFRKEKALQVLKHLKSVINEGRANEETYNLLIHQDDVFKNKHPMLIFYESESETTQHRLNGLHSTVDTRKMDFHQDDNISISSDNFMQKKIILFFLSPREAYRPIMFSTNEVFCSPDCQNSSSNGLINTIQTPAGVFDIQQVINQLPPSQQPELIVVKTDATGRNFPVNLRQYSCPKLLILGDTHHLKRPIQTLLTYAAQENFDYIVSDHDRHHLHFFKEAGLQHVYWIPCLNIYPHEQPWFETKSYDVSFVGQVGKWHPNRRRVLNYLKSNGIDVNILQTPHEKAAEIYAKSLINLNISLNGDLNLRVFEVLSSGGFLLTDRLSKESGLEMIFKNGEHLVCYDSPEDLLDKIRYYLQHPVEAQVIARNGYEEYRRRHTPEIKVNQLMEYIFNGKIEPLYDISLDRRSVYVKSPSGEALFSRIAFYEFVQDLHLHNPSLAMLVMPTVDPRIVCDLVDLPRLKIYIRDNGSQIPPESLSLFQDTEIADRLHTVTDEALRNAQGAWDIVVMTGADMAPETMEAFLTMTNFKILMISDGLSVLSSEQRTQASDFLKQTGFEAICDKPLVYRWNKKSLCGEYFFAKNRLADAIRFFERALLDNPADEDALNNLGVVSFNLQRYSAAENFFLKAASFNRRNATTLDNLIQLYMSTNRLEDATGLLQERVLLEPNRGDLLALLATCQHQIGRTADAIDTYRKARELGAEFDAVLEGVLSDTERIAISQPTPTTQGNNHRILVINNLYPPQELGGYGRLLYDFTNILRRRGHSIYVLTSNTPYLGGTEGDAPDVDRSLLLFGGWEGGVCKQIENKEEIVRIIQQNNIRLNQVLDKFQPDVCLLGNIDFLSKLIIDPILAKNIPIVHHLGNQSPGYSINETPRNQLYHVATASNWLRNVIKRAGYPIKNISVVYPGALVDEFHMRIPPAYDILRIAYASIVLPYKGPHVLINALKRLHDLGIDFTCSIAGTSTDQKFVEQLKQFVVAHGMDHKIQFLGFLSRENLKNLFARKNVLVFPSTFQEPFGISQVEAMAAGLAVVTSGTGGAKEIVEHGVSGIIFESENDESLANKLIGLAKDTQRWQTIAQAGQRRALELFNIERSVDAIEACFEELLKKKRK